ncbi:hypothetical protein DSECCO2_431530 [anaerobic digester metagenome]
MNISASKLKIGDKVYEKHQNGIDEIKINIENKIVEISYKKSEYDYKIIFLKNTESIEFKEELGGNDIFCF